VVGLVRNAGKPDGGGSGEDGDDSWGGALSPVGPGAVVGAYVLPHWADCAGGADSCGGEVEYADDSAGAIGTVQQEALASEGDFAFLGRPAGSSHR